MQMPQAITLVCSLVFMCALLFLGLSGVDAQNLGASRSNFSGVQMLAAAVPEIGEFGEFYVNDLNPFVPYDLRDERKIARFVEPPARDAWWRDPIGTTIVRLPPVYPRRPPLVDLQCKMLIEHESGRKELTVAYGGKEFQLQEGASIAGLRLLEFGHGVAKFVDGDGDQRTFVIAAKPR